VVDLFGAFTSAAGAAASDGDVTASIE
jgi:hypothetical protein